MIIDLETLGAHVSAGSGGWTVRFGAYLPDLPPGEGFTVSARLVRADAVADRTREPLAVPLARDPATDIWSGEHVIPRDRSPAGPGRPETWYYRFQVKHRGDAVGLWFTDPFGVMTGPGGQSCFELWDGDKPDFRWQDDGFTVPRLDDLIVYELHVGEFNRDFDGVAAQLDYIAELGVNALELMPVTDIKETVEWGYTPLGYFAPDERFGGPERLKRLVDACHRRGIAVIFDAVYAHAHPEFCYNFVYEAAGKPSPMMGSFAEEFAGLASFDFDKPFTRAFFAKVNRYWVEEYHADGFRYDFVPGFYAGPEAHGYAELVRDTYRVSKEFERFRDPAGHSRFIQVAEFVGEDRDERIPLKETYTSSCWQARMIDALRTIADAQDRGAPPAEGLKQLARQLDTTRLGFPDTFRGKPREDDSDPDEIPVAPFRFLENHDNTRAINVFGHWQVPQNMGLPYGDRSRWTKLRPYMIALFTAKGVPMLWQAQELVENWTRPEGLDARRNLMERPVHWEYLYDRCGRGMLALVRALGGLRRSHPALSARGNLTVHQEPHGPLGVLVYDRVALDGDRIADAVLVAINVSDRTETVTVRFPCVGIWADALARAAVGGQGVDEAALSVSAPESDCPIAVPANGGRLFVLEPAEPSPAD
jgi:1,4-alpha-glucan branching enzyme